MTAFGACSGGIVDNNTAAVVLFAIIAAVVAWALWCAR